MQNQNLNTVVNFASSATNKKCIIQNRFIYFVIDFYSEYTRRD